MTTTTTKEEMLVFDPKGEWRWIDGLYYWEDQNHSGSIWVTPEMIEKHNLQLVVEELDDDIKDEDEKHFTHEIWVDHCDGVSETQMFEEEMTNETPHGEVYGEEFAAWWCSFPLALLYDPKDQVKIQGWCNG